MTAKACTDNAFSPLSASCRPDGKKKAYIKLSPDQDALDVSSRVGLL